MTADNTGKESLAVHRLDLARELLDDIELNQIPPENLLFKASRLARLMEASDIQRWINFELKGYLGEEGYEQDSLPYLLKTGRAKKQKDEKDPSQVFGYFQSFAEMLAWIGSMETELSGLKIPDINYAPSSANPSEMVGGYFGGNIMAATKPANDALARMKFLTAEIGKVRGIVSKIRAFLHDFVAQTYYELAFRGVAESIFDSHKRQVDMLLAASAGDTLQKIPAISERLASGDTEAISHAMSTCRRVLSAFADSVQPPTSEKLPLGEKLLDAGPDKYLNRLGYFLRQNCKSESREERLHRTLVALNERFSAGTHDDVTPDEARALFVILYMTLGELVLLRPA